MPNPVALNGNNENFDEKSAENFDKKAAENFDIAPAESFDTTPAEENYDRMTPTEFEARLPDLFITGRGKVSQDPRFAIFLQRNPDCAALVSDLETIAETAKSLFEPAEDDDGPPEPIWSNIASRLQEEPNSLDEPNDVFK